MSLFAYEALDGGGRLVKGSIESPREDAIADKLRDMGFYPLKISEIRARVTGADLGSAPVLRHFFHRIKFDHVCAFTRQLATLVNAGLPILRCLEILKDEVESVLFREKIAGMARDIEEGASLSEALAKHPAQFDGLYTNMVRAGEIGGALETVLNKIALFMEKRVALLSKVKSAMAYPLTVLTAAIAIVTFILVKIMPSFVDIYAQLDAELPALTRWLMRASDVMVHRTVYVVAAIAAAVFLYKRIGKTRTGRFVLDSIKLRLPLVGDLFRKMAIVRFAGTLSTLISSGVPILQALDITRETSGNAVIARGMDGVYEAVKEGESIHEPLRTAKVFPALVVHMVAVGEETGAIDQMLTKVEEAYQRDVDHKVEALSSILEPIMIVILGGLIGVIVVALYLPLFEMWQHIPTS